MPAVSCAMPSGRFTQCGPPLQECSRAAFHLLSEWGSSFPRAWGSPALLRSVRRDVQLDERDDAGQIQPLGREVSRAVLLDVAVELETTLVDRPDDVLDAARLQEDGPTGIAHTGIAGLGLQVQKVAVQFLKPHRGDAPISGKGKAS